MLFAAGLVLFALAILISVSLHEAGHMLTAKAFGMKVTRYFVGFGPTLWSFRRGETEYGVKGVPLGGFCKIVGMTPQDDDVAPEDEPRAMWRFPVWKRTVVMSAGSVTHFMLGIVVLWALLAFFPQADLAKRDSTAPVVETVSSCVQVKWEIDPQTGGPRECVEGKDPATAAAQIGLRPGDTITAINDQKITGWTQAQDLIRASGGKNVTIEYERDGSPISKEVTLPTVERPKKDLDPNTAAKDVTPDDLEKVGFLGISPVIPTKTLGPVAAIGATGTTTKELFQGTVTAMKQLPQRVPALLDALAGKPRDPNTPISVVGATRIGGELAQRGLWDWFLYLLVGLNFFVGVFNLFPLLPLDGGHIAIAQFEKLRSWCYAKLGKPDPGRVDYYKLMPVTYAVIVLFGGFALLTIAADVINPISLFK